VLSLAHVGMTCVEGGSVDPVDAEDKVQQRSE